MTGEPIDRPDARTAGLRSRALTAHFCTCPPEGRPAQAEDGEVALLHVPVPHLIYIPCIPMPRQLHCKMPFSRNERNILQYDVEVSAQRSGSTPPACGPQASVQRRLALARSKTIAAVISKAAWRHRQSTADET